MKTHITNKTQIRTVKSSSGFSDFKDSVQNNKKKIDSFVGSDIDNVIDEDLNDEKCCREDILVKFTTMKSIEYSYN